MPTVNLEATAQLAKLLATENIFIRHANVETASFHTVRRVLTFPMWERMDDYIYTFLAGHEVGHALWTDRETLTEMAKKVDANNIPVAAAYINIVEDARIERFIKVLYPGIVPIFAAAYADLFDRNMFATQGTDINSRPFIDRINLHFKIGVHVDVKFSIAELQLVVKVAKTQTFKEMLAVTREIYEWAKNNEVQPDPVKMEQERQRLQEMYDNGELSLGDLKTDDSGSGPTVEIELTPEDAKKMKSGKVGKKPETDSQGEDSPERDDETSKETQIPVADGEELGPENGAGESAGENPIDSDEESSEEHGEAESGGDSDDASDVEGEGDQDGSETDEVGTGKKAFAPVDPGPPPEPTTQQRFDENILQFNDPAATEMVYVGLPTPNLENILIDYKVVHGEIRQYVINKQLPAKNKIVPPFEKAEEAFRRFKAANEPKVNYIFQQFQLRKQADRHKRTKIYKTGSLDTLRLASYRFTDDLFKTLAVVADGKNHALVFVIDWSASMRDQMVATIHQLLNLCLFCRKANVPFEVYSLTTGGREAFTTVPGSLIYASNFSMRNYLSSRMTAKEFQDACVNLFCMISGDKFEGGPIKDNLIGCTPLDEAIVTTIDLVKRIRSKTGAQIINVVLLTDGDANTVSAYMDDEGVVRDMLSGYDRRSPQADVRFMVEDRNTHKNYEFDMSRMTPTLIQILRDRGNINAVGFYIGDDSEDIDKFFDTDESADLTELRTQFVENGYVISTVWGFNELYILRGDVALRIKEVKLAPADETIGTQEYIDALSQNFTDHVVATHKQRMMLDRFVKMIA